MTAVYFPEGLDGKHFLQRLLTRFGIKLAAGQGVLKGRSFRISHMGMADELDVVSSLAAIELVLAELGRDVKLGVGVAAASRVLADAAKGGDS
jgi:serine---pyruvate transaminase